MDSIKRNIDIILILIVGLVLRLSVSMIHSYSNDELSAVTRLRFDNFDELIEQGVKTGDMHPAGVQLFMKAWSFIGGTQEFGMRLPFVVFGVISIYLLFLIGKQWFNRGTGLYAAGLLSVLYFPIMNSEFARPYSPGLMITLLVGYYLHKVLFDEEKKWRNAVVLGIFFAAGMYTHYFAFLFVGFMGVTGLLFLKSENWKQLLMAGLIGILLFLPHYNVTYFHLNVGGLQWLPPPEWSWLFEFLFHAFNSSWIVITVLFIAIISALSFGSTNNDLNKRNVALIILWFFGIFIVGFIVSHKATPVLKFPVMLFALPYFLLLIGLILNRLPKIQWVLPILMLVCLSTTIIKNDLYGNRHYSLFKEVGVRIAEWNKTYGDQNIYTIYNLNNPSYINFYVDDWGGDSIQFDQWELGFDSDIQIRRELVGANQEYCIIGFSGRVTTVQIFETVREFYPNVVEFMPFENGSVFLLKKGQDNQVINSTPISNLIVDKQAWTSNAAYWTDHYLKPAYLLDSDNQYGPSYLFKQDDLPKYKAGYLKVYVTAHLDNTAGLTVTFSGTRNEEFIKEPYSDENMWLGHDLEEMILNSSDNTGYFAFKLPTYLRSSDLLQISLWNRKGTEVFIEDIRIEFIENIFNP